MYLWYSHSTRNGVEMDENVADIMGNIASILVRYSFGLCSNSSAASTTAAAAATWETFSVLAPHLLLSRCSLGPRVCLCEWIILDVWVSVRFWLCSISFCLVPILIRAHRHTPICTHSHLIVRLLLLLQYIYVYIHRVYTYFIAIMDRNKR